MTERPTPAMPKVTHLSPPPTRPNRAVQDAYAEEAMRAAQRHIDQIQEIDRLGQEMEEWRRRALMAEAEIKRLEKRSDDLQSMLEQQQVRLTDERDVYRNRVNNLVAGFHTAGGIILRLLETAQGEVKPSINLNTLADEIEKDVMAQELDEELPKVITAGPRNPDG